MDRAGDTEEKPIVMEPDPSIETAPYGNSSYLAKVLDKLYGAAEPAKVIAKIKAIPLSNGVCAKAFKGSDIGWFCQVCQKDSNCVFCQSCFENSVHTGHPVYLKRNVSGCCDCGDHEAWDPKGFCTAHQGFIDEAQAGIGLLPAEVQKSVPETISQLASRLFSICMAMDLGLGAEGLNGEIVALLTVLQKISDVTPIFMYEVCRSFTAPRATFRLPNAEEEGGFQEVTLDATASTLEAVMWAHSKWEGHTRKVFNTFAISHLRSRSFKMAVGELYLKNYKKITEGMRTLSGETLHSLSCQVLGSDEIAGKVLASAKLRKKLLKCLKFVFDSFVATKSKKDFYLAIEANYDLKYLVRPGSVGYLLQNDFLPEFATICSVVSYINALPMLEQHALFENENIYDSIEFELRAMRMFICVARCGNYEDKAWCRSVALGFKKLVPELSRKAGEIKDSFFNIPVHRCLAFFVCNYAYVQLLSSRQDGVQDNTGFYVRQCLKELFDVTSDTDFNEFIRLTLHPVLKSLGFVLEAQANKWVRYGSSVDAMARFYVAKGLDFARYDLSLCAMLIGSYTDSTAGLINFLVATLSQGDNWLGEYTKLLADSAKSGKEIDALLETLKIDAKKATGILEQLLFLLCGLATNDCLCLPVFFRGAKPKILRQPYYQNLSVVIDKIRGYALRKELVHAYFKCKAPWVTIPQLLEQLPKNYRKSSGLPAIIAELSESLKDPAKGSEMYKIRVEQLSHYDPFFYTMQGNVEVADESAEEAFKKVGNPKLFNPLFGGSSICEENLDICNAVGQSLALGGALAMVRCLLKRAAAGEVSDNLAIYSLKLLRILKGHMSRGELLPVLKELGPVFAQFKGKLAHYERLISDLEMELMAAEETSSALGKSAASSVVSSPMEDSKEKLDAKAKQRKIMEEFKSRGTAFAEKHVSALKKIKSADQPTAITCGICKEELTEGNFTAEPYGQLINLSVSGVYYHYLRQNIEPHYWSLLQSKYNAHCASLVLQPCGHYMHYKCIIKVMTQGESVEEQMLQLLGVATAASKAKKCPLCSSPYTYIVPPHACLEKVGHKKVRSLALVTSILKIIQDKFGEIEKRDDVSWETMLEYLASMICYQARVADLSGHTDVLTLANVFLALASILWSQKKKKERLSSEKKISALVAEIRTGTNPGNQLLEQDYLMKMAELGVMMGMEKRGEELGQSVLFFLRLHLWQVIMKLMYAGEVHDPAFKLDKTLVAKLIETRNAEIKRLALPWLVKAVEIKLVLTKDEAAESKMAMLKGALDEVTRFDLAVDSLGYTKDLVAGLLADSNKIVVTTLDSEEIIGLINRELNNASPLGISVPIPVRTLGLTKAFTLTQLEDDYMELQKIHYKRKCKKCGLQVKSNALCLLCGEIVCLGTECCGTPGKDELWYHSSICSYGTGMFLYFARNCVALISDGKSTAYRSPYVNQFGQNVDVSKKITFESIRLNAGMLNELKQMYLRDRVYHTIRAGK